jgi:hypothetical protein
MARGPHGSRWQKGPHVRGALGLPLDVRLSTAKDASPGLASDAIKCYTQLQFRLIKPHGRALEGKNDGGGGCLSGA